MISCPNDPDESISKVLNNVFKRLPPLAYPLKLILQNAGDVEAEVRAKGQQAVEEEHHEAIIGWKKHH